MGRKRNRSSSAQHITKRRRGPAKPPTATDLDYISRDDYVIIGDFMYVRPYVFEFKMNFKPRWRNQTIYDVFCQEFKHTDQNYWRKEVREGRVLANSKLIDEDCLWSDGLEVVHIVHRHESAVLSAPIHIARDEEGFMVVSKPPSIPIHPCGTYRRNSLQFILKAFYNAGKLLAVHRLDKETSGLVILAKQPEFAAKFSAEIKEHKVQKTYLAEVHGRFPPGASECTECIHWDKREMKASIKTDGSEAKTSFRLIKHNVRKGTSVVECKPLTGRTHQIRVHLTHMGYPIVNDPLYGNYEASDKTTLVSRDCQSPLSVTINHPKFASDIRVAGNRKTFQASEWAKASLQQHGRHLSCVEEGKELSCTNCPQVTNVKNVAVQQMFIHLHALRYESDSWMFQVPPPAWVEEETGLPDGNGTQKTVQWAGCAVS